MSQSSSIPFDNWLIEARRGDANRLDHLLEAYRNYLRLLARLQLGRMLQIRVSPSDLAQESILVARKAFHGFRGDTEPEMLSWLRSVLAQRLIDANRFHSAGRRDFQIEHRLDDALDRSSCDMRAFLSPDSNSPSRIVSKREQEVILADALARLPADYSEVIVLRHLDGKSFAQVAETMNRTVPSVKSIWTRAMTRLRTELGEEIG
ncbi:MAG: sigma-70 family RNA polymerase sigma factor [Planctomycetales bacterium]|nr:sigma-70 family RNA polymerase sigma factor [Planctomycetales bacterium]